MRRNVLVALIAVGALALGVYAILRGQLGLGVCFIGLAALRGFLLVQGIRPPRKPQPSIHLNIEDSTDAGGDGAGSDRPGVRGS
jgi:hypothetical protein